MSKHPYFAPRRQNGPVPDQPIFGPPILTIQIQMDLVGNVKLDSSRPVKSVELIAMLSGLIKVQADMLVQQSKMIIGAGNGNATQQSCPECGWMDDHDETCSHRPGATLSGELKDIPQ